MSDYVTLWQSALKVTSSRTNKDLWKDMTGGCVSWKILFFKDMTLSLADKSYLVVCFNRIFRLNKAEVFNSKYLINDVYCRGFSFSSHFLWYHFLWYRFYVLFYFELLSLCVLSSQSVFIFFHVFTFGRRNLWASCFNAALKLSLC